MDVDIYGRIESKIRDLCIGKEGRKIGEVIDGVLYVEVVILIVFSKACFLWRVKYNHCFYDGIKNNDFFLACFFVFLLKPIVRE